MCISIYAIYKKYNKVRVTLLTDTGSAVQNMPYNNHILLISARTIVTNYAFASERYSKKSN